MTEETSGISQFYEIESFEYLIFSDETTLNRYSRPNIDVDHVMIMKIGITNGQVLHRLSSQSLTQDGWESIKSKKLERVFYSLYTQNANPVN